MKALEDLKELLVDQIKRVTKKGDITPNELESMYKSVDIIKDISTIEAMEKAEKEEEEYAKDGYSRGRYSREGSYDGNSMRGGSYGENMMSNDMGNSQRYLPYPMYSYAPVWNNNPQQPNNNQNGEMNGNSQGYNAGNSNDGRRGRDADNDGRYSEESSYRRGRDAMGRFTSRDSNSYENSSRYSRHSVKDRMIAKLEDMADDATTNRERNTIMQCIDKLDN